MSIERILFTRDFGRGSEERDREIRETAFALYEKLVKYGITLTETRKYPDFEGSGSITTPPSKRKLLC